MHNNVQSKMVIHKLCMLSRKAKYEKNMIISISEIKRLRKRVNTLMIIINNKKIMIIIKNNDYDDDDDNNNNKGKRR